MRATAPGRVNLIGDHTDYTGGLALPMAVDLGTTVEGDLGGDFVSLRSEDEAGEALVPLSVEDPRAVTPAWARYVAGVVWAVRPQVGFEGGVTTTLPIGSGLSSSAALEVAVALALGFEGTPLELALACQRAEQRASGVPSGIMDQLASASGVAGHALLMDCHSLAVTPVPMPDDVAVVVVHSGQARALATSAYGERRAACEAAEARIGPLRQATLADVETLDDVVLRSRARHVVTENERVRRFSAALRAGELVECGRLMVESHRSLADDFEVSTPRLDALVGELTALPGVFGGRLTGAGFGGCVVALAEPGAVDRGWRVRAADGARVE
ncbi:MAG: Galactokinase [uncultured Acidimicrobiales bacterium]|uniref:Galactokinase n=1 Tax=uncultured Acidimicrobiales bacterium TaxID=310071 RepID=A0A6J4I9K5_9ACTN|nr:MAG: Galactokinase [uncultured Acidimicrobiales bacterium]